MLLTIKKWEFKKVLHEEFNINLPESQFCFHDWNGRVRTLVRPEYSTWKISQGADKEELIGYKIIKVYVQETKIERGYFYISKIEDILSTRAPEKLSGNDKLSYDIVQYIIYHFGTDAVKFEYFKEGYNTVLTDLNDVVNEAQ